MCNVAVCMEKKHKRNEGRPGRRLGRTVVIFCRRLSLQRIKWAGLVLTDSTSAALYSAGYDHTSI